MNDKTLRLSLEQVSALRMAIRCYDDEVGYQLCPDCTCGVCNWTRKRLDTLACVDEALQKLEKIKFASVPKEI